MTEPCLCGDPYCRQCFGSAALADCGGCGDCSSCELERSARRFVAARDRGLPRRTLRARRKTAISALRRAAAGRAESARLEGVWAEREAAYYAAQAEEDVVPY